MLTDCLFGLSQRLGFIAPSLCRRPTSTRNAATGTQSAASHWRESICRGKVITVMCQGPKTGRDLGRPLIVHTISAESYESGPRSSRDDGSGPKHGP